MPRNIVLPGALLIVAAACGGESQERAAGRKAAHRDFCIAEELAVQANTQISQLDTMRSGSDPSNPLNSIYVFARANYDFAKARERQLALMDSAALAGSATDSTDFARRAAEAGPRTPSNPIELHAAEDYQRHFAEALGNPAHPCNQDPDAER
jgi:hypothetical protein